MDGELDSGLLNIALSDSEDSSSSKSKETQSRADKTAQSEADFQAIKESYRPKVENGEIFKIIKTPLASPVPKIQAHEVLHAVEELYFFRRYDEAVTFLRKIFSSEDEGLGLDEETRNMLRIYEKKCMDRREESKSG